MEIIRYYTPKIEEFKIGFEYECYHKPSDLWYKHKLVEEDLQKESDGTWRDPEVCPYSEEAKLRVQYPSDFDFRKLGFPHDRYRSAQYLGLFPKITSSTFSRGDISIYVTHETDWDLDNFEATTSWFNPKGDILIFKRTEDEEYDYLFEGKIRNMFELKQILKELKIDYCA